MSIRRPALAACALLSLTTTLPAAAQQAPAAQAATPHPSYAALGIALTKSDWPCSADLECDQDHSGLRLLLGHRVWRNLAVEGGYFNFGKLKGVEGRYLETTAFGAGVAWHQPLFWRLTGTLRAGAASVKTRGYGVATASSDDGSQRMQAYAGAGLSLALAPQLALDLGWDTTEARFNRVKSRVHMYSLGASLHF